MSSKSKDQYYEFVLTGPMAKYHTKLGFAVPLIDVFLITLLAVLAFSLSMFDRSGRVYYSIAGAYCLSICLVGCVNGRRLSLTISGMTVNLALDVFLIPLVFGVLVDGLVGLVLVETASLVSEGGGSAHAALSMGSFLNEELVFDLVPHPVALKFRPLSVAAPLAFRVKRLFVSTWVVTDIRGQLLSV